MKYLLGQPGRGGKSTIDDCVGQRSMWSVCHIILLKQMKIDFMCLGSIMRRVIEVPMIIMGGLQIATGSKRDDKIGLFQN